MQTSAIAYRVVDFVKGYPPFNAMEETDLLGLVAGGRVRFHESGEFVHWQGKPYDRFFLVIQQGSVALLEQDGLHGERLRDIRGPGDLLGIDRFLGAERHLYSVRAESDVVLYALPAGPLVELLEKYPAAARYLEAHASVSAYYEPPDQKRRVHEVHVYEAVRQRAPVTCPVSASVREAARRLNTAGEGALAVLGPSGALRGVLTTADLVEWLETATTAASEVTLDAPLSDPLVALAPDTNAASCVLTMADSGRTALPITEGGRPDGRLLGLVTARDLAAVFGEQPLQLLHDVAHAPDLGFLRTLNQRARRLLADGLTVPSTVDWLSRLAARIDAAIFARAAALAGVDLASLDGKSSACWFLFGASGRGESITALPPRLGLVLEDGDGAGLHEYTRLYAALGECGYYGSAVPSSDLGFRCASASTWKERFRAWVRDPVMRQIYHGRPLFDLQPIAGQREMVDALRTLVRDEVEAHPSFLRLLAYDCLANLPPLGFFEDLVVDETGEKSDTFHLERSALRPLVDVGRVFGIAAGSVLEGSTLERLDQARESFPDHEAIFREAAEAFRLMLYHQTRAGLRHGDGGTEISPADLSHHDRQLLKSGFRAIARLLRLAGQGDWIGEPR